MDKIDIIKKEIQLNIDDLKENGKHHADFVRHNGEMIAAGLKLALDIIEDIEKK